MKYGTLGSLLLMLTLSGCARSIGTIEAACIVLPEPSWSERDTKETQDWFERKSPPGYAHVWERLCEKKK